MLMHLWWGGISDMSVWAGGSGQVSRRVWGEGSHPVDQSHGHRLIGPSASP